MEQIPNEQAAGTFPEPAGVGTGGSRPTPPQVVIQQGSTGILVRLVAVLGWIGFTVCALLLIGQFIALQHYFDTTEGLTERYHSLSKAARNKVAIITVSGVIVDGDGYVKKQIERVRQDEDVKAIVLRVNSPGGTVTGSDYILHHLNRLRAERKLPLVVSMGSVAASGGYYVSMAVGDQPKSIYAEPTTTTGSIGVLIPHYDLSGLLERIHVKDDTLATHPRKEMLSMTKPMSDDQRRVVVGLSQGGIQPIQADRQGRASGIPPGRRGTGSVGDWRDFHWSAGEGARARGRDWLHRGSDRTRDGAGEAAKGRDTSCALRGTIIPFSLAGLSSSSPGQEAADSSLSRALELSTPCAYYLWTSLPPLLQHYSSLLGGR